MCRVCVVEVEGQKNLQPSCVFPITQALEVSTHTPRVAAARRDIIDLLLSEHYGDCRTCARNGTCELQDLAAEYGVDHYRFGQRTEPVFVRDDTGPSIVFDPDKCIQCMRCVRTCAELQGVRALGGGRPGRRGPCDDLRRPSPVVGVLHQLRPVREPLPHGGAHGGGRHRPVSAPRSRTRASTS